MQLSNLEVTSPSAVPDILWGSYFGLLTYCPSSSRHTRRIIANALLQLDTTIPRITTKRQSNKEALEVLRGYRIACYHEESED